MGTSFLRGLLGGMTEREGRGRLNVRENLGGIMSPSSRNQYIDMKTKNDIPWMEVFSVTLQKTVFSIRSLKDITPFCVCVSTSHILDGDRVRKSLTKDVSVFDSRRRSKIGDEIYLEPPVFIVTYIG